MSATRPPAFDDRFSTPIEASRRGAHRARPKPVSAGLPVIAGAGVILLVLGGGYVALKGGNGVSDSSSNRAAAGAVDDDGPTSTSTKKAAAPPASAGNSKNDSTDDSSKGDAAAPKADKSIPLTVLNSGTIKGLAARKGESLKADGWTIERTGNPQPGDRGLATSKIYYGSSATKDTATALQKELGYGNLVRNSAVAGSNKIVVVLGRDAE
jgi:LytR cell envelope-related transcriptional attenuator